MTKLLIAFGAVLFAVSSFGQELNDAEATVAFNDLQDTLGKPHVARVTYDTKTDSYYWIGPKYGKRESMLRQDFDTNVSDAYTTTHQDLKEPVEYDKMTQVTGTLVYLRNPFYGSDEIPPLKNVKHRLGLELRYALDFAQGDYEAEPNVAEVQLVGTSPRFEERNVRKWIGRKVTFSGHFFLHPLSTTYGR
jgi:hypothetical protein